MKYKIISNKENTETAFVAIKGAKTVKLLSGAWNGPYAVASVVLDDVLPDAEVHEHAADIWFVQKGGAKFILGGELPDKKMLRAGEWSAPSIVGGEIRDVSEGDLIDIPPGVAHQIDARGTRIELLIVKVNSVNPI